MRTASITSAPTARRSSHADLRLTNTFSVANFGVWHWWTATGLSDTDPMDRRSQHPRTTGDGVH